MKKQLLAAAVAATMASVASADISITGNMKANFTNIDNNGTVTNKATHETNLAVAGSTGGTKVHIELAIDDNDNQNTTTHDVSVEDVWLSTSIMGQTVKMGNWNGSDSILSSDSARGTSNADKYSISGSVSGVGYTLEGKGTDAQTALTLTGSVGGVGLTWKNESTQDQFKASGDVSGLKYTVHHLDSDTSNSDKTSVELSYNVNDVTLSYAQADTDTSAIISGDAYFGNVASFKTPMAAGDDIKGAGIKGSAGGNTLQAKFFTVDDYSTSTETDFVKLIATRQLDAGATLEFTYTDEDNTTAASDQETFDAELSIKF